MIKLMTIVGTRPELIKLSRVIFEADNVFNHTLVHTGQNYDYELNEVFFKDLKIRKPDYFLNSAGSSTIQTIANVLLKTDEVMDQVKPHALLIYGDTNSCLSAYSAKRKKIPIFHMEAGNRCFDLRVPEEINRKIVDHLSDINFPLTEQGRHYLLSEGIPPQNIIKSGSSLHEVLNYYKDQIESSSIISELNLTKNQYFVFSAHREENVDSEERLIELVQSVNSLASKYKFPIIFSLHPRTASKLNNLPQLKFDPLVKIQKPLGYFDYIQLQKNSFCVISDSGTLSEESSILRFKAIHIRDSYERPEGMEGGAFILSKFNSQSLLQSVDFAINSHIESMYNLVPDYSLPNVSKVVVRTIYSHINHILENTWKIKSV